MRELPQVKTGGAEPSERAVDGGGVVTVRADLSALVGGVLPGIAESGRDAVADALLAAGWQPPRACVASVPELDALPVSAVIADADGTIWAVNDRREWCERGPAGLDAEEIIQWAPFVVVTVPAFPPHPA